MARIAYIPFTGTVNTPVASSKGKGVPMLYPGGDDDQSVSTMPGDAVPAGMGVAVVATAEKDISNAAG